MTLGGFYRVLYAGLFPGQSNFLQSCHHCALQPLQEVTEQKLTVGGPAYKGDGKHIWSHLYRARLHHCFQCRVTYGALKPDRQPLITGRE